MNKKRMVSCPFNPGHKIEEDSLAFHFQKCGDKARKQHLFSLCRYNGLHYVKKELLDDHLKKCPDRPKAAGDDDLLKKALQEFNNRKKDDENEEDDASKQKKKRIRKGKNDGKASEEPRPEPEKAKEPQQVELNWAKTYNAIKEAQKRMPHPVRFVISNSQEMNALNFNYNESFTESQSYPESSDTSRISYKNQYADQSLTEEEKGEITRDFAELQAGKPKIGEFSIHRSVNKEESSNKAINLKFEQSRRADSTSYQMKIGKDFDHFKKNDSEANTQSVKNVYSSNDSGSYGQNSISTDTKEKSNSNAKGLTQTGIEEKSGPKKKKLLMKKGHDDQSSGNLADESKPIHENTTVTKLAGKKFDFGNEVADDDF